MELQLKLVPVIQEEIFIYRFGGRRLTGERRLYARGWLFVGA
jgi:hypothetical protein